VCIPSACRIVFDLGGHSLLAIRLIARIEKIFERKLSVATIFQQSTIESWANGCERRSPHHGAPVTSLVAVRAQGSRPPIYFVHAWEAECSGVIQIWPGI